MENTPKTDAEIAIRALAEWPEEARPKLLYGGAKYPCPWHTGERDDFRGFAHHEAIALFVAAGIAYLLEHGMAVWQSEDDGLFRCGRWNSVETIDGPTLFACLDSAIRSTDQQKGAGQ